MTASPALVACVLRRAAGTVCLKDRIFTVLYESAEAEARKEGE